MECNTKLQKNENWTSNFGMFLLVPPSNARTGKNAKAGPLMSTRKFCHGGYGRTIFALAE